MLTLLTIYSETKLIDFDEIAIDKLLYYYSLQTDSLMAAPVAMAARNLPQNLLKLGTAGAAEGTNMVAVTSRDPPGI